MSKTEIIPLSADINSNTRLQSRVLHRFFEMLLEPPKVKNIRRPPGSGPNWPIGKCDSVHLSCLILFYVMIFFNSIYLNQLFKEFLPNQSILCTIL